MSLRSPLFSALPALCCAALPVLIACSGAVAPPVPAVMSELSPRAESSCPFDAIGPGAKGVCYRADATGKDFWVVAGLPTEPGKLIFSFVGAHELWNVPLPLEPQGFTIDGVAVESFHVGNAIGEPRPEVALIVKTSSSNAASGIRQQRRALYLIDPGFRRVVWYNTLSLEGSVNGQCSQRSVAISGEPRWETMGPLVTGVVVHYIRQSSACEGGKGCPAPQKCTESQSSSSAGWVYNDEMESFRLFGPAPNELRIPDVQLSEER